MLLVVVIFGDFGGDVYLDGTVVRDKVLGGDDGFLEADLGRKLNHP